MITQEQKNRINELASELRQSLMENEEYSESQATQTVEALLSNYEEDIKWGETGMLERDLKIFIKHGI